MKATYLVLEGVSPHELPTQFLVAVMDTAKANELAVQGVSILWRASCGHGVGKV